VNHPHRLPSLEYIGVRQYSLTICTFHREPVFGDVNAIDNVRSHFLRTAADHGCDVLVHCFMPDHLHALVGTVDEAVDFWRFVKAAKQRTAYHHKHSCGRKLWQPSYFDRTLRSEQSTFETIKYIIANPVRAGLVTRIGDYPHWGSSTYTREQILEHVASENGRT
jgi:REP element-mobilizing transposase RayT